MTVLKSIAKVVALILLFVIVAILLFNLFLNIKLFEFYSSSKSIGDVPGLNDGGVQQGLDYVAESDTLLTSCYMTDKSASRIYVTKDGKTTSTALKDEDGEDYTGHVGGICHSGSYFYVGQSKGFKVYNLSDVLAGGEARAVGEVELINTASWCTVYDGHIYAGTFSDIVGGAYPPEDEYILSNPKVTGEANCSIISVYKLSDAEGAKFGIDVTAPVKVISTIGKVQGGAFNSDGDLVLSTSWGATLSGFYFYDMEKADGNTGIYKHSDGSEHEMIFLGTDSLTYKLEGPPMAEEIVIINNTMYIMNESASSKYLFGNLIGGRELYVINIKDSWLGK